MENQYVDPEMLKDGKLLVALKNRFIENKIPEYLVPLIGCLRDSVLILPFTPVDDKHLNPDKFMTPSGDVYIPVFSRPEEIPDDYKLSFSFMPTPTLNCINIAKSIKDFKVLKDNEKVTVQVKGLVLDPYTNGMFMDFKMTGLIEQMESRLKPAE